MSGDTRPEQDPTGVKLMTRGIEKAALNNFAAKDSLWTNLTSLNSHNGLPDSDICLTLVLSS